MSITSQNCLEQYKHIIVSVFMDILLVIGIALPTTYVYCIQYVLCMKFLLNVDINVNILQHCIFC